MERGYLVACLAIVTTFAGLSTGFRSVHNLALFRIGHFGVVTGSRCQADSAARAAARFQTQLRAQTAEQAQMLAEMNLPLAEMRANLAQQIAQQHEMISQCARARALQDAERARRDMMRMQQNLSHVSQTAQMDPL